MTRMRHEQSTKLSTEAKTGATSRHLLCGALLMLGGVLSPCPMAADGTGHADLRTRAAGGDPWAQLNLGAAYDHGLAGHPVDPAQAVAWYRRAAMAGVAEAQFNLAHCLATGSGVARDDTEARDWMLRAAGQGLPDARFLAGVMLIDGIGGPTDATRGLGLLRGAAADGHAEARRLLERLAARGGDG